MSYVPDPTNTAQPDTTVQAGTAAAEFRALKAYINGTVPPPVTTAIAGVVATATSAAQAVANTAAGASSGFKEQLRIRVLTSTTLLASCFNAVLCNAAGSGISINFMRALSLLGTGIGGTESGVVTANSWLGIYCIASNPVTSGLIGVQGLTVTGNTTNNSNTVTGVSSTAGMFVGQIISCAQFPAGTVILSLGVGSFVTNELATATQVGASISFMPLPSAATQAAYPYYCYLGSVRVNSSSQLLATVQYGNSVQYVVGGPNVTNLPIMASGMAGDTATPTWVGVSVASFVPPTASRIRGVGVAQGGSSLCIVAPNNLYGPHASLSNPPAFTAWQIAAPFNFLLERSQIYWATYSNINHALACTGWEDNL